MDSKPIYQFDHFYLDPRSQSLFYKSDEIKLEPRIFEVLHLFLQRPNEVITKEDFFDYVWEEKVVSDWALSRAIKEVRKKLKERVDIEWVKTLYGKGYLFTQEVHLIDQATFKSLISEEVTDKQSTTAQTNAEQANQSVLEDSDRKEDASTHYRNSEPQSIGSNAGNLTNKPKTEQAPGVEDQVSNTGPGETVETPLVNQGVASSNASSARVISERQAKSNVVIKLSFLLGLLLFVAIAAFWGARKAEPNEQRISSIVVLPISNLASSQELDYLANGLTDVIIGRLAQVKDLRVISKTSAVYYQNNNMSPREIAAELNIESILEGGVYTNGDKFNLNLRLIDAETEELRWSVNEEVASNDISSFYKIASQRVLSRISGKLSLNSELSNMPYENIDQETIKLYLRALYQFKQRRRSTLLEARDLLLKCLEREPKFAEGYALLASVYINLVGYSFNDNIDRYALAQKAVNRALELKPDSSNAWAQKGLIAFGRDYDFKAAEQAYQKAIALDSTNTSAKQWYAELLSITSRDEEALAILEDAWADDPFNRLLVTIWGSTLMINGEYQKALEKFEFAQSIGEKIIWVEREIAYTYGWMGELETVMQLRYQQAINSKYSQQQLNELRLMMDEQGMKGFWFWRIKHYTPRWERKQLNATRLAEAYAGAGDYEKMVEFMRYAIDQKSDYWLQVVKRSPEFYPYRNRPEFKVMLDQYGISIDRD